MATRRQILNSLALLSLGARFMKLQADTTGAPEIDRSIMWFGSGRLRSLELATVETKPSEIVLCGRVLAALDGLPMQVEYEIRADRKWRPVTVSVQQSFGTSAKQLTLEADASGWRVNGVTAPALAACTDVDLGVTPSTNALAINRLQLAIGSGTDLKVAWVRFPWCQAVATRQRYERLDSKRYRYSNLDSGFTAVVGMDDDGLTGSYEGVWQRVASMHGVLPPLHSK